MDLSEQEVALVLRRAAGGRTRVDEIEVALEAVLDDLEGGTGLPDDHLGEVDDRPR